MINRVLYIIRKEFLLEFRERFGFFSSILYLIAITFVVYKIFGSLSGPTKVAIFWILYLFTCINMVGNSFSNQGKRRKIQYYQLYDPTELWVGKIIFNFIKVFLAGIFLLFFTGLFSGEWLSNLNVFTQVFALSSLGITTILCLVSAISSYSDNQNSLVAILSLPLVIPILLLSMRINLVSERLITDSGIDQYLTMLVGIDLLLVGLSFVFIPIIWKS